MPQSKYRQLLLRQARVIKVQWLLMAIMLVAIIVMLICWPESAVAVEMPTAAEDVEPTASQSIDASLVVLDSPAPTIDPQPARISLGEFKLTAYCACKKCCGKDESDPWYGITASGTRATAGRTIAVDRNVIPLGTEVVINGRTYIAEDVGGAIKENRIDIYFDTHEEALEFGVQYATVYIINNNF